MYYTCMSRNLDQHIHLLLPKRDLQLLKRYAQTEKKSMGELIRQAIKKVYGGSEPTKRREAFERLSKRNDLVMEDWEEVKKSLLHRYG